MGINASSAEVKANTAPVNIMHTAVCLQVMKPLFCFVLPSLKLWNYQAKPYLLTHSMEQDII
jgi:hypothetical protein